MKYVSFLFFVASLGLLTAVADAAQIDKMYTSNGTPYIFINGEIVSGDAKRFQPVRLNGGWLPRQRRAQNLWSIVGSVGRS